MSGSVTTDSRDRGRESFQRQDWSEAFAHLSMADRERPLAVEDLERLAMAGHLLGRDTESAELMVRAHHEYLAAGHVERAARCVFWIALPLMFKGETAQAGGWLSRGRRLLDDGQHDCVERGYVLFPLAFRAIHDGDIASAYATFTETAEIARRFNDDDLALLSRQGQGRALIRLGKTAEGSVRQGHRRRPPPRGAAASGPGGASPSMERLVSPRGPV